MAQKQARNARRRTHKKVGLLRGQPVKSKGAPWYLKQQGSRPEYKRRRLTEAA